MEQQKILLEIVIQYLPIQPKLFDVKSPSVTTYAMSGSGVVTSGGDTKVSGAMTFGLTFSENVSNFSATDVSVNSGTISSVSGSNKNYSVAYTPANNVDGNVVLTVAGGNYNDSVGNSGVGSTKTFAVDTKSPTGQLTLPSGTFCSRPENDIYT